MKHAWDIPSEQPGDDTRHITVTAAAGPLLLELRHFDGFITAAEARRIAFTLNQAAHELDGCVMADDPEGQTA